MHPLFFIAFFIVVMCVQWLASAIAESQEAAASNSALGGNRRPKDMSFEDFARRVREARRVKEDQERQEAAAKKPERARIVARPAQARPAQARPAQARPAQARSSLQVRSQAKPQPRRVQAVDSLSRGEHHIHSQLERTRDLSDVDEQHIRGQLAASSTGESLDSVYGDDDDHDAYADEPRKNARSGGGLGVLGLGRSELQRAFIFSEILRKHPETFGGESDRF